MDQNHVTRKMEARLMTRASQAQEHTLPVQLPGICSEWGWVGSSTASWGPESCVVHREVQGEALTGESVGQP